MIILLIVFQLNCRPSRYPYAPTRSRYIPDTYPTHTRYIWIFHEYPTNTPRICHEYPKALTKMIEIASWNDNKRISEHRAASSPPYWLFCARRWFAVCPFVPLPVLCSRLPREWALAHLLSFCVQAVTLFVYKKTFCRIYYFGGV